MKNKQHVLHAPDPHPNPLPGRERGPEQITDYYGLKRGTTYLEIFSIPDHGGPRTVHRRLQDQEAYDTWHLSLYFKEVLAYRRMLEAPAIGFDDLPRKEKNLLVYLLLAARPELQRVAELGSSLFEMIDGLALVRRYAIESGSLPAIDEHHAQYLGIEISELLAFASVQLHPQHRITIAPGIEATRDTTFDLLYDRNVSSYAFTTGEALAGFIQRSRVALMNLFVSKGETFISARLGKSLTYFSLAELIDRLASGKGNQRLWHLFGERAPGPADGPDLSMGRPVVEGFFLYASREVVDDFMALSGRDANVKRYFEDKPLRARDARELLA